MANGTTVVALVILFALMSSISLTLSHMVETIFGGLKMKPKNVIVGDLLYIFILSIIVYFIASKILKDMDVIIGGMAIKPRQENR